MQRIESPFLRRTSAAKVVRAGKPFLSHVSIDYGPAELLARLFLRWDDDLRKRGIQSVVRARSEAQAAASQPREQRQLAPASFRFSTPRSAASTTSNGFALLRRND